MLDLNEIRSRIDKIDQQMVALFEERMAACREVAQFKSQRASRCWIGKEKSRKFLPCGLRPMISLMPAVWRSCSPRLWP